MNQLRDTLATYRLTKLIIDDFITEEWRKQIFKRFPPDTKIGYFFTCPWCMSFWAGLVVVMASKTFPRGWKIIGAALAMSAASGLIEDTKNR